MPATPVRDPVFTQPSTTTAPRGRWADGICIAGLAVVVLVLFLSSPQNGDFWWSDAPRHALNGVFLRDVAKDLPVSSLRQYAVDYYLQYPALTLLFYPPAFPAFEAVVFGFTGFSHGTALLAIALFNFAAALGGYFYLRGYVSAWFAFAAAALFLALPEVSLWGRQVMLELPACAFLLWTAYVFRRYQETSRPAFLYGCAVLLVIAAYTKQTALFLAPAIVITLVVRKGMAELKKAHVLKTAAFMAGGLLPLAISTWRFGRVNVSSVVGGTWTPAPLFSFESLTFYFRHMPGEVTWPVLILGIAYIAYSAFRKDLRHPDHLFLLLWLVLGYAMFEMIALKETRHTVVVLFPLAVFAVETVRRFLPQRVSPGLAVVVSAGVLCYSVVAKPVPYVSGYREAAQVVIDRAAPGSVVLFSGERDGSFIFNVRANGSAKDLTILRADKLLLRVTQRRDLGVVDRGFSASQIAAMLHDYGVEYAVSDPRFWDDLRSMRELQTALRENFQEIGVVKVTSNVPHKDHELHIYRTLKPPVSRAVRIRLDLPIIDTSIEGNLGHSGR